MRCNSEPHLPLKDTTPMTAAYYKLSFPWAPHYIVGFTVSDIRIVTSAQPPCCLRRRRNLPRGFILVSKKIFKKNENFRKIFSFSDFEKKIRFFSIFDFRNIFHFQMILYENQKCFENQISKKSKMFGRKFLRSKNNRSKFFEVEKISRFFYEIFIKKSFF